MKKRIHFAIAFAVLAVALPRSAWATSISDTDTVTVDVGNILSIEDSEGNFSLSFNNVTGTVAGSASTGKTVGYVLRANNMSNSAVSGALSAKISSALDGITFQANSGMTYTPTAGASAGNATLTPVSSGAVPVGTTATALFDKPASVGTQGQVLNGTAFINWGAVAARDLGDADGGSMTLTVTLKDV